MTRIPGVPLKELWSTSLLSWQDRVRITEKISEYIQQLQVLHSDRIGSLYLTDQAQQPMSIPLEADPRYSIGPVVAIPFFYGNRIKLPSQRGPFPSTSA